MDPEVERVEEIAFRLLILNPIAGMMPGFICDRSMQDHAEVHREGTQGIEAVNSF